MPGIGDVQLAPPPACIMKPPRRLERAADIVATVNENAGNSIEKRHVFDQLIAREKGGVPPIMRHQALEEQAKRRVAKSLVAHHSRAARSLIAGSSSKRSAA